MKDKSNKNSLSDSQHPGEGEHSIPVRPQRPRDGYGYGGGRFEPGKAPIGGFQSMWVFDGTKDFKNSPTTKPGKKVY